MSTDKLNVIFACVPNSARSQTAEALLRQHAGHWFDVESAGSVAHPRGSVGDSHE
jgi:protein-tyrosine-phosphatase